MDEQGKPLTNDQIFEEIMTEYANKTVTMEVHPHLGVNQASIHPCRHADVLKNINETIKQGGGRVGPHKALFIFLKFMSSIIPTIEYDFTGDLVLDDNEGEEEEQ